MSRIIAFTGDNQNPSDWLELMDRNVSMRTDDRGKLEIFDAKLAVDSPADRWFVGIPIKIRKHWRMVRELFVLKWVEKAEQEKLAAKVALFLQELDRTQRRSTVRDVFFVEPLPPLSPMPATFDLAQLQELITASDVNNISIFCAKAAGTTHGYLARLWELAFEAGKKLNIPTPHFEVGIQVVPPPQPDPLPKVDSSTQTTKPPTPPSLTFATSSLDWAQDAESLPISVLSPPKREPRDLSGLRSSSSSPFSSLQRRAKLFRIHGSHQSRPHHHLFHSDFPNPPPNHLQRSPTYVTPSRRRAFRPTSSFKPIIPNHNSAHLNWESDPRLSDLNRALKALGWNRSH